MTRPIYAAQTAVTFSCGLEVVGGFRYERYDWENAAEHAVQNRRGRGTGYCVAAFIDTAVCRDAYNVVTKKYKVLFQSPVRRNLNSGRPFFFIIYDTR